MTVLNLSVCVVFQGGAFDSDKYCIQLIIHNLSIWMIPKWKKK